MHSLARTWLIAAIVILFPAFAASSAALPKATCRATDRPESGMTGETTAAERDSGAALQGFKCNADLVGQYQGEGASWQLAAWKNCAYFDQRHPAEAGTAALKNPGVVVLDLTDPKNPKPTTWLSEPAMLDPWESLKVNPARQLLAGDQRPIGGNNNGSGFAVYDISKDCLHPDLQSAPVLPGSIGHTGQWAPDGKTYYVTPLRATPSIIAVDVTDPKNPAILPGGIYTFAIGTELPFSTLHDTEFSKDGNTAYATMFASGANASKNGLAILDVSDFNQRRPDPKYKPVGTLTWDDGSVGAQQALPVKIAGKPYIIFADEAGGGAAACPQGKSASGFPRIIDISDPAHPVTTSKLQLGVHDPANCSAIVTAPITSSASGTGPGGFSHSCHYCNVDDLDDARIMACSCFASGLRIFDIHDPANPKEMAYYKPPAQGSKTLFGSQYAMRNNPLSYFRNYDWTTAKVSFPQDRGTTSGDIWMTSQDNGFQVISLFSQVTVSPKTPALRPGEKVSLAGSVVGAASTAGVQWAVQEANGGTVDANGSYTAPSAAGTYHVTATSLVDRSKSDVATVTVLDMNRGCSTAPASVAGLVALAWLLRSRRRARS